MDSEIKELISSAVARDYIKNLQNDIKLEDFNKVVISIILARLNFEKHKLLISEIEELVEDKDFMELVITKMVDFAHEKFGDKEHVCENCVLKRLCDRINARRKEMLEEMREFFSSLGNIEDD